jgi:hypothetical protein
MTKNEHKALLITSDLWNVWQDIEKEERLNADDNTDFRYHLHRLQDMIMSRDHKRDALMFRKKVAKKFKS